MCNFSVFENREKMVLVMEYAAGGELYDFLSERKVLAEEEARRIFRQIATAVYYCHKVSIWYFDSRMKVNLTSTVLNVYMSLWTEGPENECSDLLVEWLLK